MERSDRITITALTALGLMALTALSALSVAGAPEWLEFALLLALFLAVMVGAYRFVITPSEQRQERDTE